MLVPSPFKSRSIIRSNKTLGSSSSLLFRIRLENFIPSNGEMLIQIPEVQGILSENPICFSGIT